MKRVYLQFGASPGPFETVRCDWREHPQERVYPGLHPHGQVCFEGRWYGLHCGPRKGSPLRITLQGRAVPATITED